MNAMEEVMHDYVVVERGNAQMVIDKVGGQLVSYTINGVEIMYQGALDPENHGWAATAKNLFPAPGPVAPKGAEAEVREVEKGGKKIKQTKYTHNGGIYYIEQHGFIQSAEFEVKGKSDGQCLLSVASKGRNNGEYPYEYRYQVGFEIGDNSELLYGSYATNLDNKPMLAGMGWHPGFKLHDKSEKYYIRLTNVKTAPGSDIKEGQTFCVKNVLDEGSKILQGIISADIELVYQSDDGDVPYLTLHTDSPVFVMWAKEDGMICLEPWNTTPRQISKLTTQDKTEELAKEGARIIRPGETEALECGVSVNPKYLELGIVSNNSDRTQEQ